VNSQEDNAAFIESQKTKGGENSRELTAPGTSAPILRELLAPGYCDIVFLIVNGLRWTEEDGMRADWGCLALAAILATASAAPAAAPYPASPVIADISFDWSTHRRVAPGSDNWQLTWADDDHQYGAWGDGGGFGGTNQGGRVGLGFGRIEGGWDDFRGFNAWGGQDAENPAQFDGKSWGTISIGGVLYSWVIPDTLDTGEPRNHYRYVQLARSSDHGRHWTRSDWRWWTEDNLIIPTFLVYGKDNADARDEYVYSYFIRPSSTKITQGEFGLEVHKPGALFLARAAKDRLFAGREAYEWFTGMRDGRPAWGPLEAKTPVFENPEGTGWCVSASYNPGLRRYLLATEHTASHAGVMSLFDAPEPWGPWTTVKYWTENDRFGQARPGSQLDWADNVFFLSFAPKWLSGDGRSFTLVFTGGGKGRNNDSMNTVRGTFQLRDMPRNGSPCTGIGKPKRIDNVGEEVVLPMDRRRYAEVSGLGRVNRYDSTCASGISAARARQTTSPETTKATEHTFIRMAILSNLFAL
jgi:hypothetical protein